MECHLIFLCISEKTPVILVHQMLSESTLQIQILLNQHLIISSPLLLSPKAFLLEDPQEPALQPHSDKGIGKGGKSLPPLHRASVSTFQVLSCLRVETMGIWDTILHYAIFKEILHNSSLFLSFWRAILKVSLADPFNLTSL